MKDKFKKGFCIFIYILCLSYFIITGVNDLTNKNNLVTVELTQAVSLLDVEHSVNGLIPIGTSHYYLGIAKDSNDVYVIHGSSNWLSKDFAENKTITAPKKRLDYEVEKEITARLSQLTDINMPISQYYCLATSYKLTAVLMLILAFMAIILPLIGVYLFRHKDNVKPALAGVYAVVVLLSMLLLIYVITLN